MRVFMNSIYSIFKTNMNTISFNNVKLNALLLTKKKGFSTKKKKKNNKAPEINSSRLKQAVP